jgi:hypothetical protein
MDLKINAADSSCCFFGPFPPFFFLQRFVYSFFLLALRAFPSECSPFFTAYRLDLFCDPASTRNLTFTPPSIISTATASCGSVSSPCSLAAALTKISNITTGVSIKNEFFLLLFPGNYRLSSSVYISRFFFVIFIVCFSAQFPHRSSLSCCPLFSPLSSPLFTDGYFNFIAPSLSSPTKIYNTVTQFKVNVNSKILFSDVNFETVSFQWLFQHNLSAVVRSEIELYRAKIRASTFALDNTVCTGSLSSSFCFCAFASFSKLFLLVSALFFSFSFLFCCFGRKPRQ